MKDTQQTTEATEVKVAKINAKQVIIVTLITAFSGFAGALLQGTLGNNDAKSVSTIAELQKKVELFDKELNAAKSLYKITANYMEDSLRFTSRLERAAGDTIGLDAIRYKRIKRAVFQNISFLQADHTVLQNTLEQLEKRGFSWITEFSPRVLAEFPKIKTQRLRWLEDVAIPALQEDINSWPIMGQSTPYAKAPLPKELWIFEHEPGDEPTDTVRNLTELQEEVRLIKESF